MSNHIHLNLIKDEEIVSPSPIRSQIIAPIAVAIITVGVLVWWLFLSFQYSNVKNLTNQNKEFRTQLQTSYKSVLALTAEEESLGALTAQIKAYQGSKVRYAEALKNIPDHVLPNIQLTQLEIPHPPLPLLEKDKHSAGPTNKTELAKFIITGRTSGANAFDAVDHFLNDLKKAPFTNLIQSTHIPKGAMRPEKTRNRDDKEYLRFEIECNCTPRRFE